MLVAAVEQEGECTEGGRALSRLGAFERDERDRQESDGGDEDASQDGYRENDGNHKKPFQGIHGAQLMGTATHAEHCSVTLACAAAHAPADLAAAAGRAPGRDGRPEHVARRPE